METVTETKNPWEHLKDYGRTGEHARQIAAEVLDIITSSRNGQPKNVKGLNLNWDQGEWGLSYLPKQGVDTMSMAPAGGESCGTTACVAGYSAMVAGWSGEIMNREDLLNPGLTAVSWTIVHPNPSPSLRLHVAKEMVSSSEVACDVLGMTYEHSEWLFDGSRTFDEVVEILTIMSKADPSVERDAEIEEAIANLDPYWYGDYD